VRGKGGGVDLQVCLVMFDVFFFYTCREAGRRRMLNPICLLPFLSFLFFIFFFTPGQRGMPSPYCLLVFFLFLFIFIFYFTPAQRLADAGCRAHIVCSSF
jgi:predicted membrane metal-binding protein